MIMAKGKGLGNGDSADMATRARFGEQTARWSAEAKANREKGLAEGRAWINSSNPSGYRVSGYQRSGSTNPTK
jgi:hypothetical protein